MDVEMDVQLAEIMGWRRVANDDASKENTIVFMVYQGEKVLRGIPYEVEKGWYDHSFEVWSPSSDMRDAMEVRDKVREWSYIKRRNFVRQLCKTMQARFVDTHISEWSIILRVEPIDICKAALAAQGKP